MVFFVVFVLAAVLLGVGTMLAPVLPTAQPRIGLASSLTLIFVVTGGVLWTQFIAWDTLVIDYLLFGSVSLVVLGGTMIQAHDIRDDDTAPDPVIWLSATDFALLSFLGLLCAVAILIPFFPQPVEPIVIDSSASITELDNFGVKAHYLLSAYLSQQLRQDSVLVQQAIISVTVFLIIFSAYDLGSELKSTGLARLLAAGALIALFVLLIRFPGLSQFLISILIYLLQVLFLVRFIKYHQWIDFWVFLLLIFILLML